LASSRASAFKPCECPRTFCWPRSYFPAPDGGFTDGPLLLPGWPGILLVSCTRPGLFCVAPEPAVPCGPFTAGPLLFPGRPGVPAPEFGAVGAGGFDGVFCANAGAVINASAATAPLRNLIMSVLSPSCPVSFVIRASRTPPRRVLPVSSPVFSSPVLGNVSKEPRVPHERLPIFALFARNCVRGTAPANQADFRQKSKRGTQKRPRFRP
jgi:hypothetical protein